MKSKKILIVEDEIIIAMEIADRLKSMGYEVLRIVSNGEMAIKTALSEKPDLILMDIMIQGEMDGIETASKILAHSSIPVIYLTANADESTLERAKVSDAFAYLIKPFEERELNTTIEMALYKHKMEAKLKESEERFKSLVENSSIGIFRLSVSGNILHANPSFVQILGFTNLSEILNKNISEFLIGGNEKTQKIINYLKYKGEILKYKTQFLNTNGKKITVSLCGNVVKLEGQQVYFDGTIEDITKQQLFESELIKAKEKAEESDKLKTEFLAGMSHEIRTPINTIMSYLSLLSSELNNNENSQFEDLFAAIEIGSLRLTRTIDSILNMAQFQAGTFEINKSQIDIVEDVLKNLYEEFKYSAKQRGLELSCINDSKDTSIIADKYSLSQLFVNLIDNALKYTKKGKINLNVYDDQDGVLSVDVEDSGIGISEKFLPTLFKPFSQEEQGYTRKFDGNGLGLALVKRYCDLNDAKISVSSTKGEGTKFTVKFIVPNKELKKEHIKQTVNENIL